MECAEMAKFESAQNAVRGRNEKRNMSFVQRSSADSARIESQMDTFLPPIEKPRGLILKLMFAMMRRQFGKVFTL
jgi:hypothetical protein